MLFHVPEHSVLAFVYDRLVLQIRIRLTVMMHVSRSMLVQDDSLGTAGELGCSHLDWIHDFS